MTEPKREHGQWVSGTQVPTAPGQVAIRTSNPIELRPCPFCGKLVTIYVFDDEGNYRGPLGCEYEHDPRSGLAYGIIHGEPIGCILGARDIDLDPVCNFVCDTIEELADAWNAQ